MKIYITQKTRYEFAEKILEFLEIQNQAIRNNDNAQVMFINKVMGVYNNMLANAIIIPSVSSYEDLQTVDVEGKDQKTAIGACVSLNYLQANCPNGLIIE